jgi:CHAT domain-containing protein
LLIASGSLAIEQGGRGGSERKSAQAASRAETLFENALLLADNQESESARLQLQEAMQMWVRLREPGRAAKAALQMGDRYSQARDYQPALYYYRLALGVKSIPAGVRANALNAIASIYADLYLHDLAERYFNQALAPARLVNDLPAQRLALAGLGNLYHRQGEMKKAAACVRRALGLTRDGSQADPSLLYLEGRVSQDQGSVERAKGAFEKALAIYERDENVAGRVKVLCALSALSLLASHKQPALEQAEQAVTLAEGLGKLAVTHADYVNVRELQWRAWLNRARSTLALGQKGRALDFYLRAINHINAMFWSHYYLTEASAVEFREEAQAAYREYVDLLMEEGRHAKAYEMADKAKSRVILTLIAARRARPPSEDSDQEAARRELSRSTARMRRQLLVSNLSPEQQARLQEKIEEAELRMLEAQARAEIQRYRERLVWSDPATVEQLKKQTAADDMTLAEFSLGETRSFAWLFARGEFFAEILPPRKDIEKAVRAYIERIAASPEQLHLERGIDGVRKQAGALFAMLFGGLARHIEPGQRLMVVPDGLLHYLPFEALIRNGRYLIEDHEIGYNPSASMLGLWQDSKSKPGGDKMELLAVGDPDFDPKAAALRGKRSRYGSSSAPRQSIGARVLRLGSLPRTRDEVQYIASLFPADRRRVLLGKQSTESAIKREPLGRYRHLHFATHSLIDEEFPWRSAIVLGLDGDAEEDGFLDVNEITRLNLDCDLVVVSACQTGRGRLLTGEGVVGLSRAFLQAGARSVVVSLWNVSDISTGRFMKGFYRHLSGGMSNAAALRQAKLQMLYSGKQTRHPNYWSSFVIVGNPWSRF